MPKPSAEIAATVRDVYPKLRRFFAKKVPPAEVQDLAQETIVTFLEKDVSQMEDPRRFLFGIARNKLLQHFDRRRPGQPFDSQLLSVRQVSTTLGTKLHRSTVIIENMQGLPIEWQIALELRYGEELKLTEVAEAMQMSLAQVKRYIKDGLGKMREALRTELDDDALGQRLGVEYRSA
ncbi:MAG TPA: sigma-70 family RNA polymerase sigma factor [Enhygromyxa sp.]|nr:sigma-70 family RNA polymerase sigma factor [Enhygromyxa sp.]